MRFRALLPRPLRSRRRSTSDYTLIVEELLEYETLHGSRALCHLLALVDGEGSRVCVLGNFDDAPWCTTTNAPEAVATAVAERLGRDQFRLLEWYPRERQNPFSEVTLDPVPARTVPHGQIVIAGGEDTHTSGHSAVVRFANPRWSGRSEGEVAALLGEPVVRELRSFAGLPGDYTPQRLFGNPGDRQVMEVHDHNRQVFDGLVAHIEEWTDES